MTNKICCLKECELEEYLDSRIEVKTALPKTGLKKLSKKFLVNWHQNGEAEFHIDCWEKLYSLSRFV